MLTSGPKSGIPESHRRIPKRNVLSNDQRLATALILVLLPVGEPTGSAVHLVAESTTSLVFPQIARAKTCTTPRKHLYKAIFFCKNMLKHAYVCMTAFFNDFLDASEASLRAASYGLERHGENAHVQAHTCAQQVRASAPIIPTRCFRLSCTLH